VIFLMKEKKNIMKYNTEDIYKIIDNEDYLKESKIQYLTEKEARQKRLEVYAEKIQEKVLHQSSEIIQSLVEERNNQKMTQQELADITGIRSSNLARFEKGDRIPTLLMLEKYANALGKHIEIKIGDL
jgi:DNA-binding XRE family transcriptional regulator